VITQDAAGLAQKGGATWSHIQIADTQDAILTTKVDAAKADLVIGCEAIVTANPTTLGVMREGRTFVALNTHRSPTATFVNDPDWQFPGGKCETAIEAAVGADLLGAFDADTVATRLLGDSIFTNPLMLGYAWQRGRVPLGHAALMRSIELNGVQVEKNKQAFEWGRRCAHDLKSVQAQFAAAQVIEFVKKPSLAETIQKRVDFLTAYQDGDYAAQYAAVVDRVKAAEAPLGGTRLADAVARNLFKLMAYKDEYEVARLQSDPAFLAKLADQFEDGFKLKYHLAPPLLAPKNAKGELVKKTYGGWMKRAFGVLAKFKGLRGTAFDVFGYTAERRMERALIVEYRALVDELLASLSADRLDDAVALAKLPDEIRGYGHVKERHLAKARAKWDAQLAAWRANRGAAKAA
jgi:indolepyruvate ferredoxin oxidoreductase